MPLRFRRNLTGRDALEPGEYFVDYLKHDIGQMFIAYLRCAKCGSTDALSPAHVVDRGGKVVPGWKCSCATCSVFELIELQDFGEPVQ